MKSRALSAVAAAVLAVLAVAAVAIGAKSDDNSAILAGKIDPSNPKNVILLIGDGMGASEVTLGRYYGKGAAGRLRMDELLQDPQVAPGPPAHPARRVPPARRAHREPRAQPVPAVPMAPLALPERRARPARRM
jgi:alkaline phosphatase